MNVCIYGVFTCLYIKLLCVCIYVSLSESFPSPIHTYCTTRLLMYLNSLQHTATHYNTLQHTAMHCNTLQHNDVPPCMTPQTATYCNILQHTATHCNNCNNCNTLQLTATHCNIRQHIATHCNTLQQHDMSQRLMQLEQLLQTANYELKLSKERLEQNQYWTTLNQTSKLVSLVLSQVCVCICMCFIGVYVCER